MKLKLIVAMVADDKTEAVLGAARMAGATGATVITACRGEGLKPEKTFLGLEISGQRDIVFLLVVEQKAREILEAISAAAEFDEEPGAGIAFQVAIEDAVGLRTQTDTLLKEIEERL